MGLLRTLFLLLLTAAMASGCADQNAPVTAAHPGGWILTHGDDDGAGGSADDCRVCHGTDLGGGTVGVACADCHAEGPPFFAHPESWDTLVAAHRAFADDLSWTTCATGGCHGTDLRGGRGSAETGPSCFTVEGCHGEGPPPPHGLPYLAPEEHGRDAKGVAEGEALAAGTGQVYCRNCHGEPPSSFTGGFVAAPAILDANAACSVCHPAAQAHPTNWQGANDDSSDHRSTHRNVPEAAVALACALCHNTREAGEGPVPGAPSCFAGSFENANGIASGCHAEGPGQVPHPVDGSYLAGSAHGPEAKADLTACQACHGEAGGPGDNPRFNVGIDSVGGIGCEACHGADYAHPQAWAGPNPTFHYSAGATQTACALCHGIALDGEGGVGVSCLECHASAETFALDCAACHGMPPDGTEEPVVGGTPVDHTDVPLGPHDQCTVCHGVKEGDTDGTFDAAAEYRLFDFESDANGDHWDGNINMSGPSPDTGAGYDPDTFGCDNVVCHGNDADHQLGDSQLPVEFGDY